MAAKIISQKKFAKLVASTSPLAQPPGALTRISNLLFTTRGSLQIADGSYSIGKLPAPFISPAAIAAFVAFASGQYPLYPVLATPGVNLLADVTGVTVASTGSSGNSAGSYFFSVVAVGAGSIHTNGFATSAMAKLTAASAFAGVNLTWGAVPGAVSYSVYYLQTGSLAAGALLASGITGLSYSFTGALTPGSASIPNLNTSYVLQLLIGSVTPPSLTVGFVTVSSGQFPSQAPQPAQLAPGDPNFVFDTIGGASNTYTPSVDPASVTATANTGSPSDVETILIDGWPSVVLAAGASVVLNINVSGAITISAPPTSLGLGTVTYNYSVDGGATWYPFFQQSSSAATYSWSQSLAVSLPSTLANLDNLQVQIVANISLSLYGVDTGTAMATGANSGPSVTTTVHSSFSPYGGTSGVAGVLPAMLEFAGQEILILGNGYAPQTCNPSLGALAAPTALLNTFNAAYPIWQSAVTWITGAQVTDGTNYYTATQGGVSGATAPSPWNTALGAETADGSVIWTSQGPIVASIAPRGAAHAVAYAGSLWLANTSPSNTSDGLDGPSCLKMSDSNNPNSWNPVNTAFIGRQDGTQITGLCSFTIAALGISPTGSLCVFKEFITYQVIGVFGSTSFEIQPAQTNLGCIAARSIQFLPGFGVVRFSHLGFAVFDGINDRLISEDIRPYLFGGVDSEADLTPVDPTYIYRAQSAQTIAPPMYLCAMPLKGSSSALTRLFCYDLVMKAWTVLDLPWTIDSMNTVAAGEGYPLVLAGKSDGTIQRMQSGDLTWDAGATDQSNVAWSFRSPDVFGEGGSQRIFYEQATIRGYGSPTMVQSILANLWLDGQQIGSQGIDVVPQGGSNLFEARVKIFRSGYRAHIDFSGNNGGAAGTIDSVDWAVVPKSSLARRVIS